MAKSNHPENHSTNSEITNNLIGKTTAIKKRISEVNQKLDELRQEAEKLLHPEKPPKKS